MIDTTPETIHNKIIDFSNYELDPEYKKRLEEYHKKIEDDFQEEWSKKKFKWFFKKRRQKKLKSKIVRRYSGPVFWLIEDVLEDMLPKVTSPFFGQFVDVKDVAVGDKNYFVDEPIIDRFSSYACTSFTLTPDQIKRLIKEAQQ